ncbi:hypothetical protein ACFX2I_037799 [Malus domestica]
MSSNRALEGFPRNRPLLASSEKANAGCTCGVFAPRGTAVASVWPPDGSERLEPGAEGCLRWLRVVWLARNSKSNGICYIVRFLGLVEFFMEEKMY